MPGVVGSIYDEVLSFTLYPTLAMTVSATAGSLTFLAIAPAFGHKSAREISPRRRQKLNREFAKAGLLNDFTVSVPSNTDK